MPLSKLALAGACPPLRMRLKFLMSPGGLQWSEWLIALSIRCCVRSNTLSLIPVTPAAMPGVDWREDRDLNVSLRFCITATYH